MRVLEALFCSLVQLSFEEFNALDAPLHLDCILSFGCAFGATHFIADT